jgi:hypothetical protein
LEFLKSEAWISNESEHYVAAAQKTAHTASAALGGSCLTNANMLFGEEPAEDLRIFRLYRIS